MNGIADGVATDAPRGTAQSVATPAMAAATVPGSAIREDAPRVHDPERIERRLDGAHHVDHVGADLVDQRLAARQPDPVLGGHGPTETESGGEDLVADDLGELGGPGI